MLFLLILFAALLLAALLYCFLYMKKVQKILRLLYPHTDRKSGIISMQRLDPLYHQFEEALREDRNPDLAGRERELLETRMKFAQLQNQINPHFLYNTLENIRARAILDDNEIIADMTEALSKFFRYNISKRTDVVKLSEELDNIRTYMHIQQYRFSNKFDFQVFVHDEDVSVLNAQIPKMTLQPVVENAIFHGMENKIGKGHIEIHIESDAENVYVLIEDDGIGMEEKTLREVRAKLEEKPDGNWAAGRDSDGIAMCNVNNRLKLFFGERFGLSISSTENVGTEVELVLPRSYDPVEI